MHLTSHVVTSGVITTKISLVGAPGSGYSVGVTCTDPCGNTDTQTFTINVNIGMHTLITLLNIVNVVHKQCKQKQIV